MDKQSTIDNEIYNAIAEQKAPTKDIQVRNDVQIEVMTFKELNEMSQMLAKSTIVPVTYQHRPENCFIALDLASRMNMSPMVIMQNLHIIQGKPSFSGAFIGAMLRSYPHFKNVTLNYVGTEGTDSWGAYVSAIKTDGTPIKGATVTIAIAKKEGWYTKNGSKWQTMPEVMLGYRAYAWFGRVYAPELTMGFHTTEEIQDTTSYVEVDENNQPVKPKNPYAKGGK